MESKKIEITPNYVTGLVAVIVSIYFLIDQRDDLSIVAASIYFTLACTTDTFKSKIPNLLNASLLIAGIVLNTAILGMQGFFLSLAGLGLGIMLLLLPYIMGGFGAGDVKALGALGALVGPVDLLHVFVYMGLYGGVLALLHYLFQADIKQTLHNAWVSTRASFLSRDIQPLLPDQADKKTPIRFPYAAAIAFGYYSFVHWGGVL